MIGKAVRQLSAKELLWVVTHEFGEMYQEFKRQAREELKRRGK